MKTSVYPRAFALEILGRSTTQLNAALETWAVYVKANSHTNSLRFRPEEWRALAFLIGHLKLDPAQGNPPELLRQEWRAAARARPDKAGELLPGPDAVEILATKLGSLTFGEAWALLLALAWQAEHRAHIPADAAWWTVQYRADYARRQHLHREE